MFQNKYPAFYALIVLLAQASKDSAQALESNASLLARLMSYGNLMPEIMAFIPDASQLSAEAKAMSPQDIEAAAEALVTNLAFSSAKAQAVISEAFTVAEWMANGIAPIKALISAIKV